MTNSNTILPYPTAMVKVSGIEAVAVSLVTILLPRLVSIALIRLYYNTLGA